LNITIPHKQAIMSLLDGLSPEAKGKGAVNTVVFKAGRTKGYNTDGEGFIRSLKDDLKLDPKGKNVLLFGCGGAAQAIAFVLAREGAASIKFTDIDVKRAKALAAKTGKVFPKCGTLALPFVKSGIDNEVLASDLLVNASSVGMHKGDPCIVTPRPCIKAWRFTT
jgi:shikimate dehydrogenase